MDIIERLENPDLYIDAIDDAIHEIIILRERVAELESAQQGVQADGLTAETSAENDDFPPGVALPDWIVDKARQPLTQAVRKPLGQKGRIMTTDKQTDYFANYQNVEVISGNGSLGNIRVIGQLKNGKWAVWESATHFGGNTSKPRRLRDLSGDVVSFETKELAIQFSNNIR